MEETDDVKGKMVNTPLGRGKIRLTLNDGTIVVEFDHGGGKIFYPEEIFGSLVGDSDDIWQQRMR